MKILLSKDKNVNHRCQTMADCPLGFVRQTSSAPYPREGTIPSPPPVSPSPQNARLPDRPTPRVSILTGYDHDVDGGPVVAVLLVGVLAPEAQAGHQCGEGVQQHTADGQRLRHDDVR